MLARSCAAVLAVAITAGPAAATVEQTINFTGPGSGQFANYRIDLAGGTMESGFLSTYQNYAFLVYWFGNYLGDDYDIVEGCDLAGPCANMSFVRRVRVTPTSIRFSYYTPRSIDRCSDARNTPENAGNMCGEFWRAPGIYVDGTFSDTVTPTISTIGGGAVPEPAQWLAMTIGLGVLGTALRVRRRRGNRPAAA